MFEYILCRGVRASSSFSFLEVVVGCQIAEIESASEHVASNVIEGKEKTIYLHLKKFFRGTRFTFKPFLKSLEKKYQEGDIACVSGKVSLFYSLSPHPIFMFYCKFSMWRNWFFLKLIDAIINVSTEGGNRLLSEKNCVK